MRAEASLVRPMTGAGRGRVDLFRTGLIAAAALVSAVVVYPIVRLVLYVVTLVGDSAALLVWRQPGIGAVVANTVLLVTASSVISVTGALLLAWCNERTDARISFLAGSVPIFPLLMPAISGTIGWTFMLSPSAGFINVALRRLLLDFGIESDSGPLSIFGWTGLILLSTSYLIPYAYVIIAAAFRNVDPGLDEASRVCGRGVWYTLLRVTVPSIFPAIGSAFFVVVVVSAALFSIPVILGTASGIEVLSVRIVHLTTSYPPQIGPAVVLSLGLMLLLSGLSAGQARLSSLGQAMLGGRSFAPKPVALGRACGPIRAIIVSYVLLTSVVPLAGVVIVSLEPFWSADIAIMHWGLANYRSIFIDDPLLFDAFRRSVLLAFASATAGMVVSLILTLFASEEFPGGRRLVGAIVSLPAALSHIVIAVGFILAFSGPPFAIGGTSLILFLAYLVLYLPQSYSAAHSAYSQVGSDLVEMSRVSGAGRLATLRDVQLPLLIPGLLAGWILLFVLAMADLTASVMLAGTNNSVLGSTMLELYENGTYPQLAALAVVMTLVSTALVSAVIWLADTRKF